MEARRDVFQAIADPTRREIIGLIAGQSLNLNAIAENFQVSRPAISQHIKILSECGLVIVTQKGRERFCEVRLQKLTQVTDWVEEQRKFWTRKLDLLEQFLDESERTSVKKKKPVKKNIHGKATRKSSKGK
jgi:DNA-binding transcriptional ArsR family regulator